MRIGASTLMIMRRSMHRYTFDKGHTQGFDEGHPEEPIPAGNDATLGSTTLDEEAPAAKDEARREPDAA